MRSRYVIALAASVLVIAGMFVFSFTMQARMKEAAEMGRDLTRIEMVSFNIALLWARFWGTISLFIFALAALIAALIPAKRSPP